MQSWVWDISATSWCWGSYTLRKKCLNDVEFLSCITLYFYEHLFQCYSANLLDSWWYPWLILLKREGKCWMLNWPSLPCPLNRNLEECTRIIPSLLHVYNTQFHSPKDLGHFWLGYIRMLGHLQMSAHLVNFDRLWNCFHFSDLLDFVG